MGNLGPGTRRTREAANIAYCLGELSLLDAEPRSASVSAVDTTYLFRLEHADFYALIAERPQIVRAINRVLCQMIRRTPRE